MARYEFIDVEKATTNSDGTRRYSIKQMCRWLKVSTSGYFEWLSRPVSATARRRERLKPLIVKAFTDSDLDVVTLVDSGRSRLADLG